MKRFHLILGLLVVVIFLLTGQYMDRYLAHLHHTPNDVRMFYRSRHIYILLAGLLNLGLGVYFTYQKNRGGRILQIIGSVLIVLATVSFIAAFIYEPTHMSFESTPFSGYAIYSIFAGALLHVIGSWAGRGQRS